MSTELDPRFNFDTFIVGAGNRLAVTAATAVAESPGSVYNPLFIYSDTGLGKTHLLMSIGNRVHETSPGLSVAYVTLEEFVETYHAAVAAGQIDAFRGRYGAVDVVLIDDIQFLSHRREMQAELMRLSELFRGEGKQIVLTSDRPPVEISDIDDKLIARFAGGLVVDISQPDFETRFAILRRRTEERGVHFDSGVLESAARIDVRNVRELLGLLNRLVAFQAVSDVPLTPQSVRALLTGETAGIGIDAVPAVPTEEAQPGEQAHTVQTEPEHAGDQDFDEFSAFVSDVTQTVAEQIEAWSSRVGRAVESWRNEGYNVERLVTGSGREPAVSEKAFNRYSEDLERLKALENQMRGLDPDLVDPKVFKDPDRLAEAERLVRDAHEEYAVSLPKPSPYWSFDNLLESESNRVAVVAARELLENPGTMYNPYVVIGQTGVGKSHLVHAIANELGAPKRSRVACMSTQEFVEQVIDALDRDAVDEWRRPYRRLTGLCLDDVHLIAGKDRSQAELFNLFNELLDRRVQLVFSLNAEPGEIDGLDERLQSRLSSGLSVVIEPPDENLRRRVTEREFHQKLGQVDPDLTSYLARRPINSIRGVHALVQRVVQAAAEDGVTPNLAWARDLLEGTALRGKRQSVRVRSSGVVAAPAQQVRSREKLVWRWPHPAERILEQVG